MTVLSTGAVNGKVVNAFVVDGGVFTEVATGAAAAALDCAMVATRRAVALGAALATVSGALVATRRCVGIGAASAVVAGALVGARRAAAIGASALAVNAALAARRRATARGAVSVQFDAAMSAFFAQLHREAAADTFTVPPEQRLFIVPAEPPQPEPRDLRSAPVPRDRRAA